MAEIIHSAISEIIKHTSRIDTDNSRWHVEASEDPVPKEIENKPDYYSAPVSRADAKHAIESLVKNGFHGDPGLVSKNSIWVCVYKLPRGIID